MIAGELESALADSGDDRYYEYHNFFSRNRTDEQREEARTRRQGAMDSAREVLDRNGGVEGVISSIRGISDLLGRSQSYGPDTPAGPEDPIPTPEDTAEKEKSMSTIYWIGGIAVGVGLLLVAVNLVKKRNQTLIVNEEG